jgi:hypothetical protein
MIANYFQEIHHTRISDDKKGIVAPNQKGFIRGIEGCSDHTSKIAMQLSYNKARKKPIYLAALDYKDAFGSFIHQILHENSIITYQFNHELA